MFRKMRRFKQQIPTGDCIKLLEKAPRGILAVLGDEGYPYTIPLNFVYDEGKIYFQPFFYHLIFIILHQYTSISRQILF